MKIIKFIFQSLYFLFKAKPMSKTLDFFKYSCEDLGVMISKYILLSCQEDRLSVCFMSTWGMQRERWTWGVWALRVWLTQHAVLRLSPQHSDQARQGRQEREADGFQFRLSAFLIPDPPPYYLYNLQVNSHSPFFSKMYNSFVDRPTGMQARGPELDPRTPQGVKGEPTTRRCPLTSTHTPWHVRHVPALTHA